MLPYSSYCVMGQAADLQGGLQMWSQCEIKGTRHIRGPAHFKLQYKVMTDGGGKPDRGLVPIFARAASLIGSTKVEESAYPLLVCC